MKPFILSAMLVLSAGAMHAQEKFFTRTGKIAFSSKAPVENIDAYHKSATCVLDAKTGNLQFALLMKGFEFEKALMQEHFNENYVESDKFPKAEFKGMIANTSAVNFSTDGVYPVKVKGNLTLHGVTKEVEADGNITVKDGKVISRSDFKILLSDYNIAIPKLVKDNISNSVAVSVDCTLEPLKG